MQWNQNFNRGVGPASHCAASILWHRATPIIAGWFVGFTWKKTISGVPNHLNYCVILIVYIYLQM
jgi:hypothetical protein